MTRIIVHDTIELLQPLFTSREHPKALFERVGPMLKDETHILRRTQQSPGSNPYSGRAVMQAVQQDGHDVAASQQAWGLFNPARSRETSDWQFAQFRQINILDILRTHLEQAVAVLSPPHDVLPHIECSLVPADAANKSVMVFNHGLSGFGGVPGVILLQVWPSAGNVNRLGAVIMRLMVHNLRQAYFESQALITLGDWLVMEGLAALLIQAHMDDLTVPAWSVTFAKPADWDEALGHVAALHGHESYNDMPTNIYGQTSIVGTERPPQATPMDDDEHEYALDVIREGLDESNPNKIAAYLYGDELTAAHGHPTVGLPPYAGFEVAYHLMKTVLAHIDQSPADAVRIPTADLLTAIQVN